MDEDRDDIVGILLAKDLLRLCAAEPRERFDIRECMRPAVFVPESKRAQRAAQGIPRATATTWPSSSTSTAASPAWSPSRT